MGRVIDSYGVGKRRTQLLRGIVLALREFTEQNEVNELTRDLSAFIILALEFVSETIEQSVSAWEKRGYWLKADRFRLEWSWADSCRIKMHQALINEDWGTVAETAAQIAQKTQKVKVPKRHKLGTPWVGAWNTLQNPNEKKKSYTYGYQ
jgi:hypothetical protein